jgi:hypothetical protein
MKKKSNDADRKTFNRDAASELHLGYIDHRWEAVAALAWKEYMAHGRGALVFTSSAKSGGEWDAIFLPLDSIADHPLMKEYANLTRSYDPMKQIVAIFLTPPAYVSAYVGGLTPERISPPEAYKKFGFALNQN